MKYINADEFIIPKGTVDDIAKRGVVAIHDLLEIQPSADVVEVIRCKYCKHCEKAEEKYEGSRFEPTDIVCTVYNVYTYPNEFCSFGKRRTE